MSSTNHLLKRTLSAWAEGYGGADIIARLLAQQTGSPLPESLPSWENRLTLFKAAVLFQRAQLMEQTIQPELRHLFLALDTLNGSDERLADIMSSHYLLRLDADTLSALYAISLQQITDTLNQGKEWIKKFTPPTLDEMRQQANLPPISR